MREASLVQLRMPEVPTRRDTARRVGENLTEAMFWIAVRLGSVEVAGYGSGQLVKGGRSQVGFVFNGNPPRNTIHKTRAVVWR